jgi:hypothetical protein
MEIPDTPPGPVIPCPRCAGKIASATAEDLRPEAPGRKWRVWMIVAGVALIALAIAGYKFRAHLSSAFGLLADATGGRTLAVLSIALALFLVICLLFWMTFPILVYLGMRDLRRRTARLDQTTQLYLRHLARLTTQPGAQEPEPAPESKPGDAPP